MSICRKAINFDLSTTALKEHFGDNTVAAYNAIKKFFLENGFSHRQYSGYISNEKLDDKQISKFSEKLNKKFSWLASCLLEFDVTDIGEQHTLKHVFMVERKPQKSPKKPKTQI